MYQNILKFVFNDRMFIFNSMFMMIYVLHNFIILATPHGYLYHQGSTHHIYYIRIYDYRYFKITFPSPLPKSYFVKNTVCANVVNYFNDTFFFNVFDSLLEINRINISNPNIFNFSIL